MFSILFIKQEESKKKKKATSFPQGENPLVHSVAEIRPCAEGLESRSLRRKPAQSHTG